MNKDRKRELLQDRKLLEESRESERSKEEEVNEAYDLFKKASKEAKKKGDTIPMDPIRDRLNTRSSRRLCPTYFTAIG